MEKAQAKDQLFGGRTRLHQLSADGELDDCEQLLNEGEDPNALDDVGRTPLHYAARDGRAEVCERLIKGGADIHIKSKDGWSALHYGARGGWTDVCDILLRSGANVHVKAKDGRTALHYAAANRWSQVGKLLVRCGANVQEIDEGGNTPLHLAAQYASRYPDALDLCILFIENGASVTQGNKKGKTPLDWLPKADDELERVIKRAEQRGKYGDLMKVDTKPIEVVKLFLCGASAAGKTTLKKSLTRLHESNEGEKPAEQTHSSRQDDYNPTPGIDIGKHVITGAGEFCVWDCAGQIEYHVTHAMFLGADNSIFVVVYDLSKSNHPEDLLYWLSLLRAGHKQSQPRKPRVFLVASHLDDMKDQRIALMAARKNLHTAIQQFGSVLDIVDEVFALDGRDADSQGILRLRECLKAHGDTIRGERTMPRLVEEIISQSSSWYDGKYPVLTWSAYCSKVQDLYPDVTEDLRNTVTAYLSDMGELYVASLSQHSEDVVIMNTQWLGTNVIGRVLAGEEFPTHFQKLPERPLYSRQELEEFLQYGCGVEFELVVSLLEHLKLLHRYDDGNFLIPAKLPIGLKPLFWEDSNAYREYYGRCVECAEATDMFTPNLFPRVQIRILEELKTERGVVNLTRSCVKIASRVEGMIQLTKDKRAIHVCVRGRGINDRGSCHSILQKILGVVYVELQQRSPGTATRANYLSPASLKGSKDLEGALSYTIRDLMDAELGDGVVRHSLIAKSEPVTDVLCQSFTTLIERLGARCRYNWITCETLSKLYRHLDCKNTLGQDYRSLAQAFGFSELELDSIKETSLHRNESVTSIIFREISRATSTPARCLTIDELSWVIQHPGVLDNDLAISVFNDFLNANEIPQNTLQPNFIRFSVETLRWRQLLRQHHSVLRLHINPSNVLPSMTSLPQEDYEHIQRQQDREGKIRATDLFLYTLIRLNNNDLYKQFLEALQEPEAGCATLAKLLQQVPDKVDSDTVFEKELSSPGCSTVYNMSKQNRKRSSSDME